jgi:hypothetical protein
MKDLQYENKMVSEEVKETKEVRTKNYVVKAPNGNQYCVAPEKLDQFKQLHKVDEQWTIM